MGGENRGDGRRDTGRTDAGRRWYSVRRDDFKLNCDNLADVSKQHDRVPFLLYALYRLTFALYFAGFLVYFGVASADFLGAKFFIYLTDLTYVLVTLYLSLAIVNVLLDFRKRHKNDESQERVRYQVQWLLFNLCAAVSVIVTLVYWSALRPLMDEKLPIFLDISIHLLPAVAILIDIFATTVVVRFVHVVYPLVYLFVYMVFAVIYWAAGGTDILGNPFIYPIIDFGNDPGIAAASVISVCLVTILAQAVLKAFYALRIRYIERRGNVEVRNTSHVYQTIDAGRNQGGTNNVVGRQIVELKTYPVETESTKGHGGVEMETGQTHNEAANGHQIVEVELVGSC